MDDQIDIIMGQHAALAAIENLTRVIISLKCTKEFFEKILNSKHVESRSEETFTDISNRENYIFNSTINGIEESDLILLIGTNPRLESTILNSRIRKGYLNSKMKIILLPIILLLLLKIMEF